MFYSDKDKVIGYSSEMDDKSKEATLNEQINNNPFSNQITEKLWNTITKHSNYTKTVLIYTGQLGRLVNDYDIHPNGYIGYQSAHRREFEKDIITAKESGVISIIVREYLPFKYNTVNKSGHEVRYSYKNIFAYVGSHNGIQHLEEDRLKESFSINHETGEYEEPPKEENYMEVPLI